jgi:hypothetical protein
MRMIESVQIPTKDLQRLAVLTGVEASGMSEAAETEASTRRSRHAYHIQGKYVFGGTSGKRVNSAVPFSPLTLFPHSRSHPEPFRYPQVVSPSVFIPDSTPLTST